MGLTHSWKWNPLSLGFAALAGSVLLTDSALATDYLVRDQARFEDALDLVEPGDRIVMANGVWEDIEIKFEAYGTAENPITLMAQTPGEVIISGQSNLRIGGEHLVVWGLTFRDGYSPSSEVISFRRDSDTYANNSRLVEVVIDNFNKPERDDQDTWVVLYGQNNRVDRNAFIGKTNKGPTMVVRLHEERHQENGHIIENNYFGERPPLGGNGGETLRIGTSAYSRTNSNTIVRRNYFEHCDGEVEIISIKSEGNLITENVFYESRGSVVFRHGGHNTVSRNVFLGNGVSDTGGIRVINNNQTIEDNYLEGLRGRKFLGALVVMNGIFDSPINRYHQVENASIRNNSFVDVLHLGFGVGSDEERNAPPADSVMENNVILTDEPDPVGVFDDISGITFTGNLSNNRRLEDFATVSADFDIERGENGLFYVSADTGDVGAPRDLQPVLRDAVGPRYYVKPPQGRGEGRDVRVRAGAARFNQAIANAEPGDQLMLSAGTYTLDQDIVVDTRIALIGSVDNDGAPTTVIRTSDGAAIDVVSGGDLVVENIQFTHSSAERPVIRASGDQYRGAYLLTIRNVTASGSDGADGPFLGADSATFARSIDIGGLRIDNWGGPIIDLSGEGLDGWYLADDLAIRDSSFTNSAGPVVVFGREGRDESTFGPRFLLNNSVINGVGAGAEALSLEGIDSLSMVGNQISESGAVRIRQRVLGWPYAIDGNTIGRGVELDLRGVDNSPVALSEVGN